MKHEATLQSDDPLPSRRKARPPSLGSALSLHFLCTSLFFLFFFPSKVHMNGCCSCNCCCECVWDCSTSVTLGSEESKNTAHLPFPLLLPHCCKLGFFSTCRRCREPAFLLFPRAWVCVCLNVMLQRLVYGLMWSPTRTTAVITSQPQTSHLLQREPRPPPTPAPPP